MVETINASYISLRKRLLVVEKANMDARIQLIREDWECYGVSLMVDGWSGAQTVHARYPWVFTWEDIL